MTRRPARAAFTLLELLVVIGLIAVISAVTAGVFGRIRVNQMKSATDATLNKINSLIERRWTAINGQVADDVKTRHPGYAAVLAQVQNPDLAKSIWTYAKMKNELPMSFDEAKNPTPVFGGVTIPAKAMFASLPASNPAGGTPEESAVCLYLAVTANAGGGTATDGDGTEQQIGTTASGLKCFKDAWGTPIAFVRTAYNTEVNGPPFVRAGATFDPFDPRGKVPSLGGSLAAWWAAIKPPVTWVNIPANYPTATNHSWTAISAGLDRKWGNDVYGLAAGDTDLGKDNQLSYRLRREGARGD